MENEEFEDIGVGENAQKPQANSDVNDPSNKYARRLLKTVLCLGYLGLAIYAMMRAIFAPMMADAGAGPIAIIYIVLNMAAPLAVLFGIICVTTTRRPVLYFIPLYIEALIFIVMLIIKTFCDGKFTC